MYMYASNVENIVKRFLGNVVHCISATEHILRYMLVGCSRILDLFHSMEELEELEILEIFPFWIFHFGNIGWKIQFP